MLEELAYVLCCVPELNSFILNVFLQSRHCPELSRNLLQLHSLLAFHIKKCF
jgi:hypothetical protein